MKEITEWRQQFKEYTKMGSNIERLASKVNNTLPDDPEEP